MEEAYRADRAALRQLLKDRPTWTVQQYMDATKRSRTWVKKWRKRLKGTDEQDEVVLKGLSHEPKRQPEPLSSTVRHCAE